MSGNGLIDVNVWGAGDVTRNLDLTKGDIKRRLTEAVDKAGDAVADRVTTYPPVRPSSKYKRTGTLRAGWRRKTKGGGLTSYHYNRVKYGVWVQGTKYQAQVHRGRWPTVGKILTELNTKIQRFFEYAVERAIK
jgi:hypothetical protein